ncbi:nicotinate phosphoribosyltransferase, partial [Lactobacillus delbrueckii subsp. allosunkii]
NVLSAAKYNIPVAGTMAHAWVQSYPTELEAFEKWAEVYPDNALLLVDTYDVLTSGVPNAIKVFEELRTKGHKKFGIRIDSGDIAKLSRKARKMMDDAGFPEATITASNALNENVIHSLLQEGAPLDSFGVGEQLITSSSSPVLSGVFKLAALKIGDGEWQPKIKLSNSKEKVTLPGEKKAYRLYHKGTKNAFADVIALADESLPEEFVGINMDPMMTETEANLKDFDAVLLTQVVVGPKAKSIETDTFKIQKHMYEKLAELPEETQRLLNPDRYPVYLTPALADLQAKMIKDHKL